MAADDVLPLGSEEVTLEEMEQLIAAESSKPVTLDDPDLPEEFRGKTAKELADAALRAREALRISEEARLKTLEAQKLAASPAAAPAPAAPAAPKMMSEEEWDLLYEQDPKAALKIWAEQREELMLHNLQARMAPLAAGASSMAESSARQRYADEFNLFADEIEQIKKQIPNPGFLATPEGWEQVISYVRGRPGNFEKLLEHRTRASVESAAAAARERERQNAGASFRGTSTPMPMSGGGSEFFGLDETERRVADTMGISYKEYAKWKRG